ncbi:hypothetical protein OKW21_002778 [Catalinimonas alkaloidigena]|uniref:alginate export family protein n=1 Tax=Catalinimonas alkaloidigena TaxID=1075417 RepID=UPI0024075C30|nr:alginate export family protein [Catalinimonas alkaloidigena]MDF9797515.1 hypothetical protein [Catalinimonas alkaloidigena]
MRSKVFIIFYLCMGYSHLQAQFNLGGEIRPRFEYRHGARDLPGIDDKAAVHITQRSRLNLSYTFEKKWEAYLSVQDIRVWGEQGDRGDASTFNLYEGWAQVNLTDRWKVKIGRQELDYDDGHLFNPRNWGQTGRTHDVGVVKFIDSTFQAHLVAGYSQNRAKNFDSFYEQEDYYKNLQMIWLNKDFSNHWTASFKAINRGLQRADSTIAYDQTIGGNLYFQQNKLSFRGLAYGQIGEGREVERKRAYMISAQAGYYLSKKFQLLLKADILSGTDTEKAMNPLNQETNSFDVLYGYRHKYYGHLDYFYLNFTPSTGLEDIVFSFKYKATPRLTTKFDLHTFYAQSTLAPLSDLQSPVDSRLGEELDLGFEYLAYDNVKIKGGYSQMFATESMEVLKGEGSKDEIANWFWLQASFKFKQ